MHADMYKMVHTVLLSVRRPSIPMLVASVYLVIQTAQNLPAAPDHWTLSDLVHVTHVHLFTLMTSMVCQRCAVCEQTPSVVLASTVELFLYICEDLASENWRVSFDVNM